MVIFKCPSNIILFHWVPTHTVAHIPCQYFWWHVTLQCQFRSTLLYWKSIYTLGYIPYRYLWYQVITRTNNYTLGIFQNKLLQRMDQQLYLRFQTILKYLDHSNTRPHPKTHTIAIYLVWSHTQGSIQYHTDLLDLNSYPICPWLIHRCQSIL